MRRRACIVTWRISCRCRVCLQPIRSTPAAPGAHLDPDAGTLPTCVDCCPHCRGVAVIPQPSSKCFPNNNLGPSGGVSASRALPCSGSLVGEVSDE